MKQKNREEFNCIKSFPQCIQWNLGDIPSLGIENGDYLDEIVYAIVNKLCDLADPLDISDVSLQCLIDKLGNTEPVPKSLQNVLQLLVDNECTLKDLIDNLQDQINDISNDNLVLDLKCLGQTDVYGNPLAYDLKSVLQDLINELCSLITRVDTLELTVADLQDQVDAIDTEPYVLPTVTTCISPNRRLDLSSGDIATAVCDLRSAVGTVDQINSAIGNQCSLFNDQFGTIPGWLPFISNLAQSHSNIQLALCDILQRLVVIEQTCCAPSCEKITIGFTHDFDFDSRELTLSFTSGAGTFLPAGIEDCGSEFTIKNCEGVTILTSVQSIANDADLVFVLPNGTCISNLTISIKTKFCLSDDLGNVVLTCRDCYSKEIQIQSECCTITNIGTEDVIITYSVPITQST